LALQIDLEELMAVDAKKLEQFVGEFVTDLGATVHAGTVVSGDRRAVRE
jgi:hypothetical protein